MGIKSKDEFIQYRLKQGIDFLKILEEWENIKKYSFSAEFEPENMKNEKNVISKEIIPTQTRNLHPAQVTHDKYYSTTNSKIDYPISYDANDNLNTDFTKEIIIRHQDRCLKYKDNSKLIIAFSYVLFSIFFLLYNLGVSRNRPSDLIADQILLTILYTVFIYLPKSLILKKLIRKSNEKANKEIYAIKAKIELEKEKALREEEERRKLIEHEKRQREKEYWYKLNGYEFEEQITKLYIKKGYKAFKTRGSNDGGYDIYLTVNNKITTIIQCKAYKGKLSPSTARELYGVMHSLNVEYGIIICLGGFSSETKNFVKGKNIELMDIDDVIDFFLN